MPTKIPHYHRDYFRRVRRERKKEAIKYLGGKCSGCGTKEKLEFDHLERKTKLANISNILAYNKEKFWSEIQKCQLLCRECHTKKTKKQLSKPITHGIPSSYTYRKCRCDLCRKAFSKYKKKNDSLAE